MQRKALLFVIPTVNRGAFCQFPFRWIYYSHSSKSTGKTHLCAGVVYIELFQQGLYRESLVWVNPTVVEIV